MAWKYFSRTEMRCKCCGEECMDEHFMEMLDSLRKGVNQPLYVNSGYRCTKHDLEEGGGGNHSQGKAADLQCFDSQLRFQILKYAVLLGFKRIGIAGRFIHLDMCGEKEGKPTEVIWLY